MNILDIYKINTGFDHYNNYKIFNVIGLAVDYVGEWHTNEAEAIEEQKKLFKEYKPSTFKLKPLSKTPLCTQLEKLHPEDPRYCIWNDFTGDGNTKTDVKTGHVYIFASQEEEEEAKREEAEAVQREQERKSNLYNDRTTPIIDFNNRERWDKGLKTLQENNLKTVVEMCEDAYWHFLECVPPVFMGLGGFITGEPYTHNNKGEGVYLCAIKKNDRYFAQYGTVKEFKNKELFKTLPNN